MDSTRNNYYIKSAPTEKSVASLVSNFKVLRNGKIVFRKNHTVMKRSTLIKTKNKQNLNVIRRKNDMKLMALMIKRFPILPGFCRYNSSSVINVNYNSIRTSSLINKTHFNFGSTDTRTSKNIALEVKTISLTSTKETESSKQSNLLEKLPSSRLNESSIDFQKNYSVKKKCRSSKYSTEIKIDHAPRNQNIDARLTRSKSIKLQKEERKRLDQILINKICGETLMKPTVELEDFIKKTKFLKTFKLIPRIKICPQ